MSKKATRLRDNKQRTVRFFDLTAQYRGIQKEIGVAVNNVLNSGAFILGDAVDVFEKKLAESLGARHAIGLNSGTDALLLSLMALDIGPGDEVITPAFSFIAAAEVIALRGARPVFADIDPITLNSDPRAIEKKITKKTKAIIPVHLFGLPASMKQIQAIGKQHRLPIIADAAQAIGATISGKHIGAFGDLVCLSFFPTKNLGGLGDGGAVLTNNAVLSKRIRLLRHHGARAPYVHTAIGMNSRLDTLQAACLSVKLRHLSGWIAKRRQIAARYASALTSLTQVQLPPGKETGHAYHQYTLRAKNRDALAAFLADAGIQTKVYYPIPLHHQPIFRSLYGTSPRLPESEAAAKDVLSLPIYPEISAADQTFVIKKIYEFYA